MAPLIEWAVAYAASRGAPAVESYSVDPVDRMSLTMRVVGTRKMFERAGFQAIGMTDAAANGLPRLVMPRNIAWAP